MSIRRLIVLQVMILSGLGCVYFLPPPPQDQPTGVEMALPAFAGDWFGVDKEISQLERVTLGRGTTFARKLYTNSRGDEIFVSIVLSGYDMNTSIHRPERCLPAQGWTVEETTTVAIPISESGNSLEATRLRNMRNIKDPNGQTTGKLYNLNYYWFVGYSDLSASNIERNMIDIKDRLLRGYTQRWAYVTFAANVTRQFDRFGRSETETDELIQSLIRSLVPQIIRPTVNVS